MADLGIIGGTGLTSLKGLEIVRREVVNTPYGEPSGPLTRGRYMGREVLFLARHGYGSNIPPHRVNYRANIWALKHAGIDQLIAVNAVGGIREDLQPMDIVIPHQIIDYTWSRGHTFFEDDLQRVVHIDFTEPYCAALRNLLIEGVKSCKSVHAGGVYGATQGPRLESAAEINRLERDGCDIVGMTSMPETALARELEICYATLAVVANRAAGRGDDNLSIEAIDANLKQGMLEVRRVLEHTIPLI